MKAIIVDDERLARVELRNLLRSHERIKVVGEASGLDQALELISAETPDVVFLDIELGAELGFDLFQKSTHTFRTVFVTAHSVFAVKAFEIDAVDYLLKPVNPERLASTIGRLESHAKEERRTQGAPLNYDDFAVLQVDSSPRLIKLEKIRYIKAAGDYTEIHLGNRRQLLVLRSLKRWEEDLPANHFLRIHRSYIVNLNHVVPSMSTAGLTLQIEGEPSLLPISRQRARLIKKLAKV